MRRVTIVGLSVLVVAYGAVAYGGIAGTLHDFSGESWSGGQICLPCHVPHNAQTYGDGSSMILWNHELTDETFTMYADFATERPDRDQDTTPGGPSKLCLSCHDGATALDAYGGGPDPPSEFMDPAGGKVLGTDLRNDHPIGIQYPADGTSGYHDASTLTDVKLVNWGGKTNRVECTSCHEPHSDDFVKFLRKDNGGSALCLECHDK